MKTTQPASMIPSTGGRPAILYDAEGKYISCVRAYPTQSEDEANRIAHAAISRATK